jgi:hypothetical protein
LNLALKTKHKHAFDRLFFLQVFDIPSAWVTALKQVKWPEQWDDKCVRVTFPASAALIEEAILSAYPLEFGVASMRF